ncbi:MAG: hypothetical protein KAS26_08660, partial [Sulfurimonas sp.]|nr:hypothetical protein [Sulfurimonas sp.]
MSLRVATLILYLLFVVDISADTNTAAQPSQNYIDKKQKDISKKVVEWSYNIDNGLSRWIYNAEDEIYCEEQEQILNEKLFENNENSIDEFFKNEKFIDETEKRFLRIRLGTNLQSKNSTSFNYKIRVHIPLTKTKKNIKLFIDNIKQDYSDDTIADDTEKTPGIGVSYFSPEYHKIKSKYSLGTRGLNPYVRARYSRVFKAGNWKIEPTQQFKYSIKYDWSEETNIYFDRALEKFSLFRTTLHRKTKASYSGMDYRVAFSYYYTPKKKTGLSLTQSFWGNTKYRYTIDGTTDPATLSEP